MKVKICGVCRPEDARAAAAAGADYIGVILAPGWARTQAADAAAAIYAEGALCQRVGVFVDQSVDEVSALADALDLAVLQLHGGEDTDEVAALIERTGRAVWKTIRPGARVDLHAAMETYGAHVRGLLLDAAAGTQAGGTGTAFDWNLAAHAHAALPAGVQLIVAGGLRPENVKQAITLMNPHIVDVSSGVEQALGRKSPAALHAFVRNAKS